MKPWTPFPMWRNGSCFIIGGGASLPFLLGVPKEKVLSVLEKSQDPKEVYSSYLEYFRDKHVIGINEALMLGHWIDVLFFGDNSWFLKRKKEILAFPKLKVSCAPIFQNADVPGIKFMKRDTSKREGLSFNTDFLTWNYHSGGAAINLAVHFGVKRIYLLGFDMCTTEIDGKHYSHWHSFYANQNKNKIKKPPFDRHLKGYTSIAKDATKAGIEIINLSPNSRIDCFPKGDKLP